MRLIKNVWDVARALFAPKTGTAPILQLASPYSGLTPGQLNRAHGVMLGMACGDALGAPHEFGPPLPATRELGMTGGGGFNWAPGEWTDDTSMAIVIARVAATGLDLRSLEAQDKIADGWAMWSRNATDVGIQTRRVLGAVWAHRVKDGEHASKHALVASQRLHEESGRSGGNGSLMRCAPIALAYLHDSDGLTDAAYALSKLTHWDFDAGEACVLWCHAIRHAVRTGVNDIRVGLAHLHPERAVVWRERINVAESSEPKDFRNNGWVVEAFQGAWSAIYMTKRSVGSSELLLRDGIEAAVRGGRDTDTVACIAGGLLGAACGSSAIPQEWRLALNGWPAMTAGHLDELTRQIIRLPELAEV